MSTNGEKKYPLNEDFTELQGEGVYAGAVMHFIRLAGCNVGRRYPDEMYKDNKLPIYTEECQSYDGRRFSCDTDYRVKERLAVSEIVARVPDNVHRVCITGGEPCMHDLGPLLTALIGKGKFIHIETSGTKLFTSEPIWVTVAPKKNFLLDMLVRANEVKLLVDSDFTPYALDGVFKELALRKPVYLHPVNYENTINVENLKLCREWQKEFPQFRIGVQLHKAISMLVKEHVR